MLLRPKYSLKLFLLFATAVTVFLGYSQIRRQTIREMSEQFYRAGFRFETYDAFRDQLWQRKPRIEIHRDSMYLINNPKLETDKRLREVIGRGDGLGLVEFK